MPHHRLNPASLKLGRAILIAGVLGLGLTACGRRGPLEPPPNATNAIDLPDRDIGGDEDPNPGASATPFGRPPKANRNFTVPEKPFVLDPIL